jgi:hypothetical protein
MCCRRLVFAVLVLAVFTAASLFGSGVQASRQRLLATSATIKKRQKPTRGRFNSAAQVRAGGYLSPGHHHKLMLDSTDAAGIQRALDDGAVELADYGSFRLFSIDERALGVAAESSRLRDSQDRSLNAIRDDLNVLILRSATIDTTADDAPGTLLAGGSSVTSATPDASQFRLVQFVGPVKSQWLDKLRGAGLEPVAYVPNNGYLVRADADASKRLLQLSRSANAAGESFIQWEGPFEEGYKIHPRLAEQMDTEPLSEVSVAIQIVRSSPSSRRTRPSADIAVRTAVALASSLVGKAYQVGGFTNVRMKILAGAIGRLAAIPGVVNIEPWTPPQLFDEQSSQILANALSDDGKRARSPGFMTWLSSHGFQSRFGFAIDVTDTGVDRGSTEAANLHPDFMDAGGSRLIYARDYTSDLDPSDIGGHGTLNLSIAGGSNLSADKAVHDSDGYGYGIGVAPFALLGSSKIFDSTGRFGLNEPYTVLISEGYQDGARVLSNSWGDGANEYTIDSQEYDTRSRDALPSQPGNQELLICFAAGNSGPGGFVSSLGSAKNVLAVAASESSRTGGTDGCNVRDSDADNVLDLAYFSSGGPLDDGRMKPDIAAPGTHIQGAASQHPDFIGDAVCGRGFGEPYFPDGQTLYTWSSGTSHSTPQVAGAAALARQFLLDHSLQPNTSMIKALLLNTTTYMTGANAGGDLPQEGQGWGLMNIDRAFDAVPKIFVNQTTTFTDSGQEFVVTGEVKDSTKPFRVTLAWTDSPGFSAFAPWVNDLDLEVVASGHVYRGNNFKGAESQIGGVSDTKNNVEAVWLPAGISGSFLVRVRATNIAGDGVPGNLDFTDQDFALVVYNGEKRDVPVAALISVATTAGPDSAVDPGETVSMKVTLTDVAPNALTTGHGTLTTSTAGIVVTGATADFPTITPGQSGESTAFTFTVASSVACGTPIQFALDVSSGGTSSRVVFSVPVGRTQNLELFGDDIEASEANWSHASAFKAKKKKKKKQPIDTWSVSSKKFHSGSHSWFSSDPGSVADAHLDTIQVQLPSDLKNLQLVFFHTFAFEAIGPFGFDGAVLEISTGDAFEDLGPKILSGGYSGTLLLGTDNPLAGRPAWLGGRIGAFQQVVVDLSSFAGKTVTIRFRFGSDETGSGPGWFIDDVVLRGDRVTCVPATE